MNGNGRLYLIAALIGLPPMLVLLTALAPGFTARARAAMQERARLSLMLGGINLTFFFGLGLLIEVGFAPIEIVAVLSLTSTPATFRSVPVTDSAVPEPRFSTLV